MTSKKLLPLIFLTVVVFVSLARFSRLRPVLRDVLTGRATDQPAPQGPFWDER